MVYKVRKFHLNHKNLVFIAISFLFAYFVLRSGFFYPLVAMLGEFGYVSALFLGFLFSFGFLTAPAAAALYLLGNHINPFFMALIAAVGSMCGNFIIYYMVKYKAMENIRYIFTNELRLEFSKFEIAITKQRLKNTYFKYLVPALTGILTALPLPTEMFVSILWNLTKVDTKDVLMLSYVFSFIGILFLGLL